MITPLRLAVLAHLRALLSPYALAMFALGLWLGYLGAIDEYRACAQEPLDHDVVVQCPDWVLNDN